MKLSQNRQAILELFEEKERSLTIDEILKGLSRPRDRYQGRKADPVPHGTGRTDCAASARPVRGFKE